jgi:hypothetical protein
MYTKTSITLRLAVLSAIALVASGVLFQVQAVHAGPVTNSTPVGSAPFTKLGIYNTVWGIENNGQVLELGNQARDIASTNALVFKPSFNYVVATQGVNINNSGSLAPADIYIPGDLCLYDHANGSAVTCRHTVPAGSASTLWRTLQDTDIYGSTYQYIQPQLNGLSMPGVRIGSSGSPITGKSAFAANYSSAAISITNTQAKVVGGGVPNTAIGMQVNGDLVISNSARIYDTVFIRSASTGVSRRVWGLGNDGVNSKMVGENFGLDADLANGNQTTIENASACTDSDVGKPHVACVCFLISSTSNGFSQVAVNPAQRHCIDLANRF